MSHGQNLAMMATHLFEKHCIVTHGDIPPFIPSLENISDNGLKATCTFTGCPWQVSVR